MLLVDKKISFDITFPLLFSLNIEHGWIFHIFGAFYGPMILLLWMPRADRPENPRRLNSAPQKRGTKSSTDLAS